MGPPRDLGNPVSLAFLTTACNYSTASLVEEIIQVQKAFLRSFCASLEKHGEARVSMHGSHILNACPLTRTIYNLAGGVT